MQLANGQPRQPYRSKATRLVGVPKEAALGVLNLLTQTVQIGEGDGGWWATSEDQLPVFSGFLLGTVWM